MEKTISRKFEAILLILFWVWVALFALFYITSSGASAYRRVKLIPWLKEMWGIVRHQPAAIEHLNSHARQAILTRLHRGETPDDPQSQYFSRWNASYLGFQLRAVNEIQASHAALRRQNYGESATTKTVHAAPLSFAELYRSGNLKITGASTSQPDTVHLLLKPSSEIFQVEINLPSPLRAIAFDHISIRGTMRPRVGVEDTPFSDYVRIYWLGAPTPAGGLSFSGERSFPVDLRGLTEKGVATARLGDNYLYLSSGDIQQILLEFSLAVANDVSLERIEFSPDVNPAPAQKAQSH
jgi:hypothetical protein